MLESKLSEQSTHQLVADNTQLLSELLDAINPPYLYISQGVLNLANSPETYQLLIAKLREKLADPKYRKIDLSNLTLNYNDYQSLLKAMIIEAPLDDLLLPSDENNEIRPHKGNYLIHLLETRQPRIFNLSKVFLPSNEFVALLKKCVGRPFYALGIPGTSAFLEYMKKNLDYEEAVKVLYDVLQIPSLRMLNLGNVRLFKDDYIKFLNLLKKNPQLKFLKLFSLARNEYERLGENSIFNTRHDYSETPANWPDLLTMMPPVERVWFPHEGSQPASARPAFFNWLSSSTQTEVVTISIEPLYFYQRGLFLDKTEDTAQSRQADLAKFLTTKPTSALKRIYLAGFDKLFNSPPEKQGFITQYIQQSFYQVFVASDEGWEQLNQPISMSMQLPSYIANRSIENPTSFLGFLPYELLDRLNRFVSSSSPSLVDVKKAERIIRLTQSLQTTLEDELKNYSSSLYGFFQPSILTSLLNMLKSTNCVLELERRLPKLESIVAEFFRKPDLLNRMKLTANTLTLLKSLLTSITELRQQLASETETLVHTKP